MSFAAKKLIEWEGYRQFAYRCTEDVLTLGIGRVVQEGKGPGISLDEATYLLENDISRVEDELKKAYDPWYSALSEGRRTVLISMAFQLGMRGLAGFKMALASCSEGDWQGAKEHFMDSKWAREQTPNRATKVCELLIQG
jgi:lysozyme